MKSVCLIFVFAISLNFLFGQNKIPSATWKFKSILNAGLLNGESPSAFQLQTINGVSKGSWFGGIGVGIDYYNIRSVPLFFDIRKEFGKSVNNFFVYGDAGTNLAWPTDNEKNSSNNYDHFSNGFYTDLGLGYSIHVSGSNHFNISLGYSYKKISETADIYFMIPMYYSPNNPGNELINPTQINSYMNRLSIKIGWEF